MTRKRLPNIETHIHLYLLFLVLFCRQIFSCCRVRDSVICAISMKCSEILFSSHASRVYHLRNDLCFEVVPFVALTFLGKKSFVPQVYCILK